MKRALILGLVAVAALVLLTAGVAVALAHAIADGVYGVWKP